MNKKLYCSYKQHHTVTYGCLGAPGIGEHPPGGLDRTTDHLPGISSGRTIAGAMSSPHPVSSSRLTYRCLRESQVSWLGVGYK